MRRWLVPAATLVLACQGEPARPPPAPRPAPPAAAPERSAGWFPTTAELRDVVDALAAPGLRGRGSGTSDELAAAERVAGWMRAAGLEPAGDGGYLAGFDYPGGHSQNVIGLVRGRDPSAGHVVIGAHYDHLGADGDMIYPGADDNASGVAGLIGVGAALAHAGQRPRRTVVVIGFGAEELGLLGSAAYVAAPALPLEQAAAMINLDMIGRPVFLAAADDTPARGLVPRDAIGALASPGAGALIELARSAARAVGRPLVAASDFGPFEGELRRLAEPRGDHASFAAAGVPYLWLSTGTHADYHRPTDTADAVDPATVAAVGRVVVGVVDGMPDRAALQAAGDAR